MEEEFKKALADAQRRETTALLRSNDWRAKCEAAERRLAGMREALERWQHYGCPDCGGDCASANPPIYSCLMQETRAALASTKDN